MKRATVWVALLLIAAACGGPESGPTPIPPPPPPPPPANNAPVIDSISVQGTRTQQPANFADVNEVVNVEARVRDDETAVDQLTYNWSAPSGTFSGTGAKVTWQAPPTAQTPQTVTLTLQIVERYGTNLEHRVEKTVELMLHDSVKEVGDMARQFLLDFSDSSKDASVVLRNFDPNCYGYSPERDDVNENRQKYRIVASEVGPARVTVGFGGICPFRTQTGDACAQVRVFWRAVSNSDGSVGEIRGVDHVAAMYSRDQKRWRLCDSQFDADANVIVPRGFIR
jgi:hypothetical protein